MLSIQVIGADTVQLKLGQLSAAIKDLSPAFDDMKDVIIQEYVANYDAEGNVLEAPWEPRRHYYPWPLENKTGTMMGNYQSKTEPTQLTISNPTEYATYQHFGTAQLPPRKLIGASANILQIINDRILKYLKSFFTS